MTKIKYFLGVGQGKKAKHWLSQRLPAIEFYEAPNYLRFRTSEEIAQCGVDAVKAGAGTTNDYVLCAESQAAPAAVEAVYTKQIPIPKRLILVQPLGLNYEYLGNTPYERRKELFRRSRRFWRHENQTLFIKGNFWTALGILLSSLRYSRHITPAYLVGANQNCREQLKEIAAHIPVDIYASEHDSLFPYHEVIQELRGKNIVIHKLPGTHLNRATPRGVAQLKGIFQDNPS